MIKYLKYMFVVAIVMIAATGCQEDWEDTFSKEPTAPELVNNGMILMTKNTMSESITWAWSAARFMQGEVSYALYTQYGTGAAVQVGTATKDLSLTMTKTDFHTLLEGISGIPENNSFDLAFYVVASDANGKYESAKQTMKVYAYGDAVSAVVAASVPELVLDINDPAGEVQLLSWEAARLTYNEAVTYAVSVSYDGGEAIEVAKDLTGTTCTKTVDEWNELIVATGAPEAKPAEVQFTVTAYSETYPDGVPSAPLALTVTTYKATYPAYIQLTGTDKKLPQSTLTKGLFECFVNLASDTNFKLLDPDSAAELGSDDAEATTDDKGNKVINGTIGGNTAISLSAGTYRISASMKFNTLQIVKVESLGLIGSATVGGWDKETPLEYDGVANTYSVVTTLTKDGEYKPRANDNWGYAIDADGIFKDGGDNFKFEGETGEYKVVVDVNKHPFAVKVLSTAFPTEEFIYIPGNHQGWSPEAAQALRTSDFDGVYKGFSNLNGDFKFTKQRAWGSSGDEYNSNDFSTYEGGLAPSTDGSNINMPTAGFYYIVADVMNAKLTATATTWGIIGDATAGGWDSDQNMTWDSDKKCWTATLTLTDGTMKFRANDGWDINVGGKIDDLSFGGDNMTVQAGTYDIELYLERTASDAMYCTMTKK
ncbi:SusE domain-containing protein [Bacteroides cellulosilyticus]|uniref:SusE domain-containing protein n=1 Tax=Bacteroides cellulosilyticus TaxID=246787 RepID=UPI0015F3F075|nr:SusF/SusE family outer membrane protein [Bacteroides cellulosilyticus]